MEIEGFNQAKRVNIWGYNTRHRSNSYVADLFKHLNEFSEGQILTVFSQECMGEYHLLGTLLQELVVNQHRRTAFMTNGKACERMLHYFGKRNEASDAYVFFKNFNYLFYGLQDKYFEYLESIITEKKINTLVLDCFDAIVWDYDLGTTRRLKEFATKNGVSIVVMINLDSYSNIGEREGVDGKRPFLSDLSLTHILPFSEIQMSIRSFDRYDMPVDIFGNDTSNTVEVEVFHKGVVRTEIFYLTIQHDEYYLSDWGKK